VRPRRSTEMTSVQLLILFAAVLLVLALGAASVLI
jgi:hypothetical protein